MVAHLNYTDTNLCWGNCKYVNKKHFIKRRTNRMLSSYISNRSGVAEIIWTVTDTAVDFDFNYKVDFMDFATSLDR